MEGDEDKGFPQAEFTRADAVESLNRSAAYAASRDREFCERLRRQAKRVKVANNWRREYYGA